MGARLFSTFKRVKTVKVEHYDDFLASADGQCTWSMRDTAIYMDMSGDTSFVMPLPPHIPKAFGTQLSSLVVGCRLQDYVRIEQDDKTGTYFVRTRASVDAITELYSAIMRRYKQHADEAVRERVIVISAWCHAPGGPGLKPITYKSGQGLFMADPSQDPIVRFRYKVFWKIRNDYYVQDDPEFPPQWYPIRDFGVSAEMPWSEELEAACGAFQGQLATLSANLARFIGQPPEQLALAMTSASGPQLTFQS